MGFEGDCETEHHHRPKRLFLQQEIGTKQQEGCIQTFYLSPARAVKHYGGQYKEDRRKQIWLIIFKFNTRHQENRQGGQKIKCSWNDLYGHHGAKPVRVPSRYPQ